MDKLVLTVQIDLGRVAVSYLNNSISASDFMSGDMITVVDVDKEQVVCSVKRGGHRAFQLKVKVALWDEDCPEMPARELIPGTKFKRANARFYELRELV